MAEPGPRNLITDVNGLLIGQAEDAAGITGTTVVLAETPAIAAVDVRGGAPGSRETELLDQAALVTRVDAIVLSGGSAFGLDAAGGVMEGLAAMGRGFPVRDVVVPIVPAAILFDLGFPGRVPWSGEPPYRRLGREALARAGREFGLGNAGAGLGAKAGRLKGGIGSASLRLADGAMVGALVAVNSWGSVVRPDCGRLWAAELALAGEIEPQPPAPATMLDPEDFSACAAVAAGANTTIAVVATDAPIDRGGCRRLAIMAQDGLAQAIRPAHTPFDGDTVFALSTNADGAGSGGDPALLARLGSAAAACLARAIMRAAMEAAPLGGFPSWRQRWGGASRWSGRAARGRSLGIDDRPIRREGHADPCSGVDFAVEREVAAMQFDDRLDQRQAEPRSLLRPAERRIDLLEGCEHATKIGGRDADAGIAYGQHQPGCRGMSDGDLDMSARRGEFDRIREEVEQDLRRLALVGAQQRDQIDPRIDPAELMYRMNSA